MARRRTIRQGGYYTAPRHDFSKRGGKRKRFDYQEFKVSPQAARLRQAYPGHTLAVGVAAYGIGTGIGLAIHAKRKRNLRKYGATSRRAARYVNRQAGVDAKRSAAARQAARKRRRVHGRFA
jgi:hypothetical protein